MDIQAATLSTTHRQPSLSIGRIGLTAVIASLLLSTTGCSSRHPAAGATPVAAAPTSAVKRRSSDCLPSQLQLSLDGGDGRFNGMSHSGTMLVLRNKSASACTLPSLPTLGFADANGRAMSFTVQASTDSATGSKAALALSPGASVSSDMTWVSGDVYDSGHCETPNRITVVIGTQSVSAGFAGHVCGEGGKPSRYTITAFKSAQAPTHAPPASSLTYACDDGHTVQAAYPDSTTAVLIMDGETHLLRIARSADGTRYVGDHWQWWTKGMHQAQLTPLMPGESIAAAAGTACTAH